MFLSSDDFFLLVPESFRPENLLYLLVCKTHCLSSSRLGRIWNSRKESYHKIKSSGRMGEKESDKCLWYSVVRRFPLRLACCPATLGSSKDNSSYSRPCQGWTEVAREVICALRWC